MNVRCGEERRKWKCIGDGNHQGSCRGDACLFADTMRCDAMSNDRDSRSRRPFRIERMEKRLQWYVYGHQPMRL